MKNLRKDSYQVKIRGMGVAGVSLFLFKRMMEALISFGCHGMGHLFCHRCAVSVLERPHTLKVKDAYPITLAEDVAEIRLQTRHRA